ncbi:MAG: protein-glutamate O-methyltransferase CheR [Nitrospinota bacterium]
MINEGINNEEMELLSVVHRHYGYDFRNYAPAMIKRRLASFMFETKFESLPEVSQRIVSDRSILESLIYYFSITVTEMFRNPLTCRKLRESVIPYLKTYPHIKIWHAGCATGEEVYSMAILLKEEGIYDRCHIYATDINDSALNAARDGIFPIKDAKKYSRNYKEAGGHYAFSDYYSSIDNSIIMDRGLKENIIFANHNLVSDHIFGEMNIIMCRNVLIYFNDILQEHILNIFFESLTHGGFLCVGNSESIKYSNIYPKFREIARRERIYQKKMLQ